MQIQQKIQSKSGEEKGEFRRERVRGSDCESESLPCLFYLDPSRPFSPSRPTLPRARTQSVDRRRPPFIMRRQRVMGMQPTIATRRVVHVGRRQEYITWRFRPAARYLKPRNPSHLKPGFQCSKVGGPNRRVPGQIVPNALCHAASGDCHINCERLASEHLGKERNVRCVAHRGDSFTTVVLVSGTSLPRCFYNALVQGHCHYSSSYLI